MDSPKFSQFDVSAITFKVVRDHEIQAYIFIPKTLQPGTHPVIVKIHGGGFVRGSGIYPEWFAEYVLDLAVREGAIIVAPNYRLLPESSMLDMLEDLSSFWLWFRGGTSGSSGVDSHLPTNYYADLSRVLVYGESVGGYLAIQSALTQSLNFCKAMIAAYPVLDLEDAYFNERFEKHPPMLSAEMLDEYLAAMEKDPVKRQLYSSVFPEDRPPLFVPMVQQGRLKQFMGNEDEVYPLRMLELREKARPLPYILMYHGSNDTLVPPQGSEKFVRMIKAKYGPDSIDYHLQQGAKHGLDQDSSLDLPWLKESLVKIRELWLGLTKQAGQ